MLNYCGGIHVTVQCYIDVNVTLELEKDDKDISVIVFAKTLSKFLKEGVSKFKDNEDQLTEIVLTMEEVDFYLSENRKFITSIAYHPKPEGFETKQNAEEDISACSKNSTLNTPD